MRRRNPAVPSRVPAAAAATLSDDDDKDVAIGSLARTVTLPAAADAVAAVDLTMCDSSSGEDVAPPQLRPFRKQPADAAACGSTSPVPRAAFPVGASPGRVVAAVASPTLSMQTRSVVPDGPLSTPRRSQGNAAPEGAGSRVWVHRGVSPVSSRIRHALNAAAGHSTDDEEEDVTIGSLRRADACPAAPSPATVALDWSDDDEDAALGSLRVPGAAAHSSAAAIDDDDEDVTIGSLRAPGAAAPSSAAAIDDDDEDVTIGSLRAPGAAAPLSAAAIDDDDEDVTIGSLRVPDAAAPSSAAAIDDDEEEVTIGSLRGAHARARVTAAAPNDVGAGSSSEEDSEEAALPMLRLSRQPQPPIRAAASPAAPSPGRASAVGSPVARFRAPLAAASAAAPLSSLVRGGARSAPSSSRGPAAAAAPLQEAQARRPPLAHSPAAWAAMADVQPLPPADALPDSPSWRAVILPLFRSDAWAALVHLHARRLAALRSYPKIFATGDSGQARRDAGDEAAAAAGGGRLAFLASLPRGADGTEVLVLTRAQRRLLLAGEGDDSEGEEDGDEKAGEEGVGSDSEEEEGSAEGSAEEEGVSEGGSEEEEAEEDDYDDAGAEEEAEGSQRGSDAAAGILMHSEDDEESL